MIRRLVRVLFGRRRAPVNFADLHRTARTDNAPLRLCLEDQSRREHADARAWPPRANTREKWV